MNARQRIIGFFRQNHDEELSQEDCCVKFNISQSNASTALNALVRDGDLERYLVANKHGGGVYLYRLCRDGARLSSLTDYRGIPTL